MISSISSTLSALQAFGKKMGVTANNVANLESEEFKKSRAVFKEGRQGEVAVDIEQIDTPGPIITETKGQEIVEKELSNVDLTEEIPQMMIAKRAYQANTQTIKAHNEMVGSLIDIFR